MNTEQCKITKNNINTFLGLQYGETPQQELQYGDNEEIPQQEPQLQVENPNQNPQEYNQLQLDNINQNPKENTMKMLNTISLKIIIMMKMSLMFLIRMWMKIFQMR